MTNQVSSSRIVSDHSYPTYLQIALLGALSLILLSFKAIAGDVRFVEVHNEKIHIGLPVLSGEVMLVSAGCFEDGIAGKECLYRGSATGQDISVDRISRTGRDRMFDRFVLVDSTSGQLGQGRYADRLEHLSALGQSRPWPTSIKGLQDIRDWDDAKHLGVAHATLNIPITGLIQAESDATQVTPENQYAVDGKVYVFDANRIQHFDRNVRAATDVGINTIAVILCTTRGRRVDDSLTHPSADIQKSPNGVTAVDMESAESERRYRAVMGFLGQRYSRSDNKYGQIGGYIIGNEVQSHWYWHNMGEHAPRDVIRQYADQVRLSYYALRQHSRNAKVFISMDHYWTSLHGGNNKKAMPGRTFLDAFASDIRQHGNIPWHVASHPYPEDLFQPAFWNDREAWHAFDTPKITFRNIEVLLDYLLRNELLYRGERRRVILSEQGLHAGDSRESEIVQAAAFAASFVRIESIEGIDAYILHRHVDHPREGGLKLGLRKHNEGQLGRERLIYRVYAAADSETQDAAFRFALPVLGIQDWPEILPKQGPFPQLDDHTSTTNGDR